MNANSFFENDLSMVRLVLGSKSATDLKVSVDETGYARAVAHFTRRQAIALAYRILDAANQAEVPEEQRITLNPDVAPESKAVA